MSHSLELDLNLERSTPAAQELLFVASADVPLSRAQLEFNRLMKRLKNAQAKHLKEQASLDQMLHRCIHEFMPMIEEIHRLDRDLVFCGKREMETLKLTKKRRQWYADLISGKASGLLKDPSGLSHEDLDRLQAIIDELGPSILDIRQKEAEKAEFDLVRSMVESAAKHAGIDLDLSDLDADDPEEFDRQMKDRLWQAQDAFEHVTEEKEARQAAARKRKPTKAQLERELKLREQEEAKTRNYKSLFKQLAKVLHPDLETDPVLKDHKEIWMKRLTTAYANGDLHDMLRIEMEWLGEEAGNLATASDAKLKVYCSVLKEQIAGLKDKTDALFGEPQYRVMDRFCDPYSGEFSHPSLIQMDLKEKVFRHREMLHDFETDEAARREMIHQWADAHARACTSRRRTY